MVVRNGDANHAGEKRRRHTIHQKMEGNILLVSEPCQGEEEKAQNDTPEDGG